MKDCVFFTRVRPTGSRDARAQDAKRAVKDCRNRRIVPFEKGGRGFLCSQNAPAWAGGYALRFTIRWNNGRAGRSKFGKSLISEGILIEA